MSWFSISGGMIEIGSFGVPWVFGLPWLLPLFFLISGFIISVGQWTGIHIYSRRRQSGDYWFSMLLLCIGIFVIEALYWNLFFGLAR
jgi:surface polysaccharide O-acyltransferase-like enzyme